MVTAEKRQQDAQDVPAALTVLARETIRDSGVASVQDIARLTPNLILSDQGSSRFFIATVRGIGGTVRDDYFNSAIGIHLDGAPLTNAEFNRRLGDVEQVEILRGPQGTLYGHNTPAGIINLTSRAAADRLEADIIGLLGNKGQREATASISIPLNEDGLSTRLFADYVERDGFTDYAGTDHSIDRLKALNASATLRYAPQGGPSLTLTGAYEHHDQGSYAYQPFDSFGEREIAITPPNKEVRETRSVTATLRHNLGSAELTAISSYRAYDVDSFQDLGYNPFVSAFGGGRTSSVETGKQFSQEFRINGRQGPVTWLVGGFFQTDTVEYDYLFNLPAFGPASLYSSRYKRWELAGFGEAIWVIGDGFEVTAGLRTARERHHNRNNAPSDQHRHFTLLTPKFRAAYRFDQDRLIYVSATRGARSGGFDRLSGNPGFDSEYLWSYEAGLKSEWLDRTLAFNLAVFRINWSDQQIKSMPTPGVIMTTNAGRSRSHGVEIDLNWRAAPGFDVIAFAGVTRGEYRRFTGPTGTNLAGNKLVNTPEVTGGAAVQYRAPIGGGLNGFVRAEYRYVGDQFFDPENRLRQDGYGLVNLRVGIETPHVSMTVFAKNLFDKDYRAYGYTDFQGSPFATDTAVAGQSRQVGVTIRAAY